MWRDSDHWPGDCVRYLAREKDVADHWYPADSRAQARVDEYLEWQVRYYNMDIDVIID